MRRDKPRPNKQEVRDYVKKKRKIKRKNNSTCIYCKCNNPLIMTVDHRIPKIRGGEDNEKNMDCVCNICNRLKGCLTDKEFRKYLKALILLKELDKISIIIESPRIIFNHTHYPDYGKLVSTIKKEQEEVKT